MRIWIPDGAWRTFGLKPPRTRISFRRIGNIGDIAPTSGAACYTRLSIVIVWRTAIIRNTRPQCSGNCSASEPICGASRSFLNCYGQVEVTRCLFMKRLIARCGWRLRRERTVGGKLSNGFGMTACPGWRSFAGDVCPRETTSITSRYSGCIGPTACRMSMRPPLRPSSCRAEPAAGMTGRSRWVPGSNLSPLS